MSTTTLSRSAFDRFGKHLSHGVAGSANDGRVSRDIIVLQSVRPVSRQQPCKFFLDTGSVACRGVSAVSDVIQLDVGQSRGFSNFLIGLEPFESLKSGAQYLAQRGILPTASIWMPLGKPVLGSIKLPDVDYYSRVIELFAELYQKYSLAPPDSSGLNVCLEMDINNFVKPSVGKQF